MVYICSEPNCNKKVLQVDVKKHEKMHEMERLQRLIDRSDTDEEANQSSLSTPIVFVTATEEAVVDEEKRDDNAGGRNDDEMDYIYTENNLGTQDEEMIGNDMGDLIDDIVYDDASIQNPAIDNDTTKSETLESSLIINKTQKRLAIVHQILMSLKQYKNSILEPIEISVVGVSSDDQNIVEKASVDLRNELRERLVSKHTTEFIYGFFNRYLNEIGNGEYITNLLNSRTSWLKYQSVY